jgi:hypothetical protein
MSPGLGDSRGWGVTAFSGIRDSKIRLGKMTKKTAIKERRRTTEAFERKGDIDPILD